MRVLLALEFDEGTLHALQSSALDWGVIVVNEAEATGLRRLEDEPQSVALVLIGRVADPIRVTQRASIAAPNVPLVLVGSEDECQSLGEALRFTAFVGPHVQCLRCSPADSLIAEIASVLERARKRRQHRETLGVLNRKLTDDNSHGPSKAAAAVLGRLLEVAPIGVTLTDRGGRIRAINPRGVQLLGDSEAQLIGAPLGSFFPASECDRLRALLDGLNGDPNSQPKDVFRSDRGFELLITGARLSAQASGSTFLVLLQDETERLALLTSLNDANRRKDEFLAMLGHELRNPLAPIRTALELMRLRGDLGSQRERDIIERHVQRLMELVNDLLDVSRITSGKINLDRRRVEPAIIIAEAVEMVSPLLDERRHTLRLDVAREGLAVDADPGRLVQVVSNLLSNAAKNTPAQGSIWVSARRAGEHVAITVRDSGCGIDPDLLPTLFDSFVQGEQTIERSGGGLGLGLSIVRSLVEMHAGAVSVVSEPGAGAEFVVSLPAASAADMTAAPHREIPAEVKRAVDQKTARVLVVDDNEDAAVLLGQVLETMGYVSAVAYDGPSALRLAAEQAPDVAVLDIGLPVMDGYELAGRLRALPGLDALPMLAVTGYGAESDRARSADAGFSEHLVKPVQIDALRSAIERLVVDDD